MTDESKPFRALANIPGAPQVKGPATPLLKRTDRRSQPRPVAPVRHQDSGRFRKVNGGRRGQ
jgi:hypothetical protein